MTDDAIVEAVARALCSRDGSANPTLLDQIWHIYTADARAAIAALDAARSETHVLVPWPLSHEQWDAYYHNLPERVRKRCSIQDIRDMGKAFEALLASHEAGGQNASEGWIERQTRLAEKDIEAWPNYMKDKADG